MLMPIGWWKTLKLGELLCVPWQFLSNSLESNENASFLFRFYGLSRLFHSFWAQSISKWVKIRDPREKTPNQPQAELGLSHMWQISARLQPTGWDDKRFRVLKISILNHSATGVAVKWRILYNCLSCFRILPINFFQAHFTTDCACKTKSNNTYLTHQGSHSCLNIPLKFTEIAWAASWQNQQNDCAQWSLRSAWIVSFRPVWSESSLCAQWVAKDPRFHQADSEDSDQTGRMPRLIWVFTGCTGHLVGFVMRRLTCVLMGC